MATGVGDALRDYVIELLESDGHRVAREPRVNTKKVDALLKLEDEYVPRTIAIECKNVDHNLSQAELTAIFTDYHSLIESKAVNEVWVVTRLGFSPEAQNWPVKELISRRSRFLNSKTGGTASAILSASWARCSMKADSTSTTFRNA